MLDPRLSQEETARLTALDVDWRNAWAGPDKSKNLKVFPAGAASVVAADVLETAGLATVCSVAEPMRRNASHRAELISEVRGGEWLIHILSEDDWALVQTEDGYVGWIANWTLIPQSQEEREAQRQRLLAHYRRPLGTLWSSDHWASAPIWLGTPLLRPSSGLTQRGTNRLVELANGESGWLDAAELESEPAAGDWIRIVLNAARSLLGTPYRWGGRTPTSLDCSGLVQICHELAGMRLPRDSAQQQHCGVAVEGDVSDWQAGDLLFFGEPADHVGIYDGRGGMLHCRGFVRRDLLEDIASLMKRRSSVRRLSTPAASPSLWLASQDVA